MELLQLANAALGVAFGTRFVQIEIIRPSLYQLLQKRSIDRYIACFHQTCRTRRIYDVVWLDFPVAEILGKSVHLASSSMTPCCFSCSQCCIWAFGVSHGCVCLCHSLRRLVWKGRSVRSLLPLLVRWCTTWLASHSFVRFYDDNGALHPHCTLTPSSFLLWINIYASFLSMHLLNHYQNMHICVCSDTLYTAQSCLEPLESTCALYGAFATLARCFFMFRC